MRRILAILALVAFMGTALAVSQDDISGCVRDGRQLGISAADQFCTQLENEYYGQPIFPMATTPQRLCERALIWSCKNAMASQARNQYPLCTSLINSDWSNARQRWVDAQNNSCLVVLPRQ